MLVVLDANHFREYAHATTRGHTLRTRITEHQATVYSCIVAAEESLQGWMTFIRRKRAGPLQVQGYNFLQHTIDTLARLTILPFDSEAAELFQELEQLRLGVGTMDLKIASICLLHNATLLTRNGVDFEKIPGLISENWLD